MTTLKPWRDVAVPHADVLEGTFQQAEFAADISAVRNRTAPREYQDAAAFFERTFLTEGMRNLLTRVAERLNGRPGEPVIQLQTAFGGGKTHTMLAVYHLATRDCPLKDLAGVPGLLDRAGLPDVPRARVAILDGMAHAPAQPWRRGSTTIRTLWGELAWQLGGSEAYATIEAADASGTSPGKEALASLLKQAAPCVVLIDELVAYVRQFDGSTVEGARLPGGTFDSNLSFVQALTEAVKQVPGALVLASLPESDVEAGSSRGVAALRALEKTFGRVQALWKPVATEEAFGIVRRRLFEPIRDLAARDATCRAFADLYASEGARLPSETREARYAGRLKAAYPISPEFFDRLFEDWSTLDGFQRTRGVLKLMARLIYRLWKDGNADLLILPGSLPLADAGTRDELTYHLAPGWDAVIEKDIDGERAEATDLDARDQRFGAVSAARRIARTVFLGSAPSSVGTKPGIRGIDRARVLLGCMQPGHVSSLYSDALNRLADRLHYLNASGDKTADATRFWFDTRANLRREMEDRKGRFDAAREVRGRVADLLGKALAERGLFEGVHVFTPHGDIPDDAGLRLVALDFATPFDPEAQDPVRTTVTEYAQWNGGKPRFRANRLLFLAADNASVGRMKDAVRTVLAWGSIVADIEQGRLNIDRLQENQARQELATADSVARRAVRDCYRRLVAPVLASPSERSIRIEVFLLNAGAPSLPGEIERVATENELVISAWSPVHLRGILRDLYWKDGRTEIAARIVREDMLRYLYLPRLRNRGVFDAAVSRGAQGDEFFGTALGRDGDRYEGFGRGAADAVPDDALLLVEPGAAREYAERMRRPPVPAEYGTGTDDERLPEAVRDIEHAVVGDPPGAGSGGGTAKGARPASFFGSADVGAAAAKVRLVSIADDIVAVLASNPEATVKVTIEISADFPRGVSDAFRRAVSGNAEQLEFKDASWE